MNDEMRKALEADGEKLRQMTGQDHGPVWKCAGCGKPGLEHCCDCVTDVVCRVNETTHEHAVKTRRPKTWEQLAGQFFHDERGLRLRILRLERALREIQSDAASVLDPENKPGYELREYAEQIHAMAASALSSGDPIKNEAPVSQAT